MLDLKKLQESGDAPGFLTEEGLATLRGGYLRPGENPRQMWERVSRAAASALNKPELASKFFDLFWKGWLGGATPVLANMGTDNLPISCYSASVSDSTLSIFNHYKEIAMMSKYGGGTGSFWGNVRSSGSPISKGGKSAGVVPWLKTLESVANSVSQGSSRRGAVAAYLPIEHGDAEDFIEIRNPTGDINRRCLTQSFHAGVSIGDEFMMNAIENNGKERKLFNKLLSTRFGFGEPYIFFRDTVNEHKPKIYKDLGLHIETSNLCVAPETKILTDKGHLEIGPLEGQTVNVWNGERWSEVLIRKTGENQPVVTVKTEQGNELDCTPYHKFYVDVYENYTLPRTKMKRAHELQSGDELIYLELPPGESGQQRFTVESVTDKGRTTDTFCFEEPFSNMGVFNGILTGQCSEILSPTDEKHSFVCCLSSMNLEKYDEWKNTDAVYLATWFLDGVMTDFLSKAKHIEGLENAVRFAEKARTLGLGVFGYQSLLQKREYAFDSFDAMMLNSEVFRKIDEETKRATSDLAKAYGEPEWCKGYGVRNAQLVALAPTTSNALIGGGVSQSIEPWASNLFEQKSAKGTFIRTNPILKAFLSQRNLDTFEVWEQIRKDRGSVQSLKGLSKEEKAIFLTAREINQFAIVKQAAQRQKWIDHGQSLNLFFTTPSNLSSVEERRALTKYFKDVHIEAWKSDVKTLYYARGESATTGKLIIQDASSCAACEG